MEQDKKGGGKAKDSEKGATRKPKTEATMGASREKREGKSLSQRDDKKLVKEGQWDGKDASSKGKAKYALKMDRETADVKKWDSAAKSSKWIGEKSDKKWVSNASSEWEDKGANEKKWEVSKGNAERMTKGGTSPSLVESKARRSIKS